MADPKRLKPVELPELGEFKPLPLPGDSELAYRQRLELIVAQYEAISPELAHARIEEARAMSEQARYQFAVPAEEQTKQTHELTLQVRYIAGVLALIGVVGIVAAAYRPEAGTYIAAIVGVAATIFGGIFGIERLRRTKKEPPHDAPPKSS